jgi:hypothetical protein
MKINRQNFKINDQYSICLDHHFDLESLHSIFPDIVKGLVKSKQYFEPIEIGNQRAIFDKEHVEPKLYIRDVFSKTEEYATLVSTGFTESQIYDYVLLRFPVKTLGTKLLLRTYPDYSNSFGAKHIERLNRDQPAYDNFPKLREWISNCAAFKSIGRILFFVNELGSYTPTHCDYANLTSLKDQFIWINLYQKKKFFVLDENWNKQYLKGEINIFDNATWHGSEPASSSCFTIRIDGLFSDKFLSTTGLDKHYADAKTAQENN